MINYLNRLDIHEKHIQTKEEYLRAHWKRNDGNRGSMGFHRNPVDHWEIASSVKATTVRQRLLTGRLVTAGKRVYIVIATSRVS